jgi:LmbE family N-acetylglucosaminyl deacetylase
VLNNGTKLKVLALSAHTDDFEIGAGGTVARLIEDGAVVHVIAFSRCQQHVPSGFEKGVLAVETLRSASTLGIEADRVHVLDQPVDHFPEHRQDICQYLWEFEQEVHPDIVLAPCSHDIHQDHQVIHQEAVRIFKHATLLGYYLPWNCLHFQPQWIQALKPRHCKAKLDALACYQSQQHKSCMDQVYLGSWLRFTGQLMGAKYAEAFEVIRVVVR